MSDATGHSQVLRALAIIEGSYRHAHQARATIQKTAGTLYDAWGKKVENPQAPDFHKHLLARRTAALTHGRGT